MEPTPPPHIGMNVFIPWELMEWVVGVVASTVGAVGLWVWRLGVRVDRSAEKIGRLSNEVIRLENKVERLESTLAEKLHDADQIRAKEFRDLRIFIESQMQQLTGRIDGLIDARLRHSPRRSSEEQ